MFYISQVSQHMNKLALDHDQWNLGLVYPFKKKKSWALLLRLRKTNKNKYKLILQKKFSL